jgi:hypothetical protein
MLLGIAAIIRWFNAENLNWRRIRTWTKKRIYQIAWLSVRSESDIGGLNIMKTLQERLLQFYRNMRRIEWWGILVAKFLQYFVKNLALSFFSVQLTPYSLLTFSHSVIPRYGLRQAYQNSDSGYELKNLGGRISTGCCSNPNLVQSSWTINMTRQ